MCPEREQLAALFSGKIEPQKWEELRRHVDSCASCGQLVPLLFEETLGHSDAESAAGDSDDELPRSDPRHYQIEDVHARGGLGVVLRARDRRLGRQVALKQMVAHTPALEARFRREALLTARLQHPSIVPVYEAGRWPTGQPFYVMRLVSGRTLAERIAEARTLPERLALLPRVAAVADALAYAHAQAVIHRDLKPANVMVGDFGETVLLDWGLAKSLRDPDSPVEAGADLGREGETAAGSVLGTPRYMSPEQAVGGAVDTRADVYGLGAMLYELLSGKPPFAEVAGPAILYQLEKGPPTDVAELEAEAPPDLVAIVRRAMARDPGARYPSAGELRDDLGRYLTGQLVHSHRYSTLQLVGRFVARHRAAFAVAGVLLVAMAVLGVESFRRVSRARALAERARSDAEVRRDQLTLAQASASLATDPTAALAWLASYPIGAPDWAGAQRIAGEALDAGSARHVYRRVVTAQPFHHGDGFALAGDDGLRLCRAAGGECRTLPAGDGPAADLAFSPDDRRLALIGQSGAVQLWNLESGQKEDTHGLRAPVRPLALHFTPDGGELFCLDGGKLQALRLADGRRRAFDSGEPGLIFLFEISPRGDQLAATSFQRHGVRLWNLSDGSSVKLGESALNGANPFFSPDGTRLYLGLDGDPAIEEWQLPERRTRRLTGHKQQVLGLASAKGALVSGGEEGELRVWSDGQSRLLDSRPSAVAALAVSSDGEWVAVAGEDGTVRLVHPASGDRRELRGHHGRVEVMAFSADGKWLLTSCDDRTTRIWPVEPPRRRVLSSPPGFVAGSFLPDGSLVWAHGDQVEHCDAAGESCWPLPGEVHGLRRVRASSDGRVVAFGELARLWQPDLQGSCVLWDHSPRVGWFSPDGKVLAAGWMQSSEVWLFDSQCKKSATLSAPANLRSVAFTRDSKRVAVADTGGHVSLFGLDGVPGPSVHVEGMEQPSALDFSPDGSAAFFLSEDGKVRRWRIGRADSEVLGGHQGLGMSLEVSPDGAQLASVGGDETVRFWDLATGKQRVERAHHGPVTRVHFSPDGSLVGSAGEDGIIRLWERDGELRELRAHDQPILDFGFSPDGRRLISAGRDGTVQLWTLPPRRLGRSPAEHRAAILAATSARLDAADLPATR